MLQRHWFHSLFRDYSPQMMASRSLVPLSAIALVLVYFMTMSIVGGIAAEHLYSAMVNVSALFLCFVIVSTFLNVIAPSHRPLALRAMIHIVMAMLFAFGWYALVLAGFAIGGDWLRDGIVARAFSRNTLVWQLHQGVIMYVILVLYRAWQAERNLRSSKEPTEEAEHLLLRQGDEMFRVTPSDIVRVSGAGDYCELVTGTSQFMSTKSLRHFQEKLAPDFARIHRSHLVRIGAIERTEPAGNGRVQLYLSNGETLVSSRSGGRLLRGMAR